MIFHKGCLNYHKRKKYFFPVKDQCVKNNDVPIGKHNIRSSLLDLKFNWIEMYRNGCVCDFLCICIGKDPKDLRNYYDVCLCTIIWLYVFILGIPLPYFCCCCVLSLKCIETIFYALPRKLLTIQVDILFSKRNRLQKKNVSNSINRKGK